VKKTGTVSNTNNTRMLGRSRNFLAKMLVMRGLFRLQNRRSARWTAAPTVHPG
jgi:hypothetical protein